MQFALVFAALMLVVGYFELREIRKRLDAANHKIDDLNEAIRNVYDEVVASSNDVEDLKRRI